MAHFPAVRRLRNSRAFDGRPRGCSSSSPLTSPTTRTSRQRAARDRHADGLESCETFSALAQAIEGNLESVTSQACRRAWQRLIQRLEPLPTHDLVTTTARERLFLKSFDDPGIWSETARRQVWCSTSDADGSSKLRVVDADGNPYWVTHNDGWLVFRIRERNGTVKTLTSHLVLVPRDAPIATAKCANGKQRRIPGGMIVKPIPEVDRAYRAALLSVVRNIAFAEQ